MKKLVSALALALCLSAASMASAAVQEFGPDFCRFTLDVPAGWTTQPVDGGIQLVNGAQDTSLAVVVAKTEATDAKVLAEALAKESGYANPTIEKQADGTYAITGKVDGDDVATLVGLEDGKMLVFVMAGKDLQAVAKIADTLQEKK